MPCAVRLYPTSQAYNVTGVSQWRKWKVEGGSHTAREPPPPLGEMVVPQAKTLGTHKIYFDPSPPFEADGDKQLNTHAYLTGTPPNPRPHASPGIFACNTRFPRPNPSQLTSIAAVSIESPPIPRIEIRPSCPTSKSASRSLAWEPELVREFLPIFFGLHKGRLKG